VRKAVSAHECSSEDTLSYFSIRKNQEVAESFYRIMLTILALASNSKFTLFDSLVENLAKVRSRPTILPHRIGCYYRRGFVDSLTGHVSTPVRCNYPS